MTEPVLAQLAALKGLPAQDLKRRWRELFDTEPPPYNRRFLESRLAYRIQERAYGGLKPETVERLEAPSFFGQTDANASKSNQQAGHWLRHDLANAAIAASRAITRSPRRRERARWPASRCPAPSRSLG
jgi:hypothetical protein